MPEQAAFDVETRRVTMRVPVPLIDEVERLTDRYYMNQSELFREALRDFVNQPESRHHSQKNDEIYEVLDRADPDALDDLLQSATTDSEEVAD